MFEGLCSIHWSIRTVLKAKKSDNLNEEMKVNHFDVLWFLLEKIPAEFGLLSWMLMWLEPVFVSMDNSIRPWRYPRCEVIPTIKYSWYTHDIVDWEVLNVHPTSVKLQKCTSPCPEQTGPCSTWSMRLHLTADRGLGICINCHVTVTSINTVHAAACGFRHLSA